MKYVRMPAINFCICTDDHEARIDANLIVEL